MLVDKRYQRSSIYRQIIPQLETLYFKHLYKADDFGVTCLDKNE